ncbi:hypothetical protein [Acidovorax sp. CCYZU-2555]|uniref:hypothetical protein n=1 Tax=Acidovorax sp. CCYZU-2555 TaxID=2835042 RepID=UPI001BCBE474|nr:hypothetical protein [Acidovorax sp. CCYZU-2555]MBS7780130.1 hypothetical protein [Acidovorax sp. CCYZU-2555]
MDFNPASPSLPPTAQPAVNWGSLKAPGPGVLRPQNQTGGFAWSRPAKPQSRPPAASSDDGADPTVLRLMALPSDAAFDTSGRSMDEHFRRIWDTRKLLFMHPHDMVARGLVEGDLAHVTTVSSDEQGRGLAGMRVVPFDLPRGSVGGYFSECNPLLCVPRQAQANPLHAANIPVRVKSATA